MVAGVGKNGGEAQRRTTGSAIGLDHCLQGPGSSQRIAGRRRVLRLQTPVQGLRDRNRLAVEIQTQRGHRGAVQGAQPELAGNRHGSQQLGSVEYADGQLVADIGPGGLLGQLDPEPVLREEAHFLGHHQGGAIG